MISFLGIFVKHQVAKLIECKFYCFERIIFYSLYHILARCLAFISFYYAFTKHKFLTTISPNHMLW